MVDETWEVLTIFCRHMNNISLRQSPQLHQGMRGRESECGRYTKSRKYPDCKHSGEKKTQARVHVNRMR